MSGKLGPGIPLNEFGCHGDDFFSYELRNTHRDERKNHTCYYYFLENKFGYHGNNIFFFKKFKLTPRTKIELWFQYASLMAAENDDGEQDGGGDKHGFHDEYFLDDEDLDLEEDGLFGFHGKSSKKGGNNRKIIGNKVFRASRRTLVSKGEESGFVSIEERDDGGVPVLGNTNRRSRPIRVTKGRSNKGRLLSLG